jgi:uncharacterized membrane protein
MTFHKQQSSEPRQLSTDAHAAQDQHAPDEHAPDPQALSDAVVLPLPDKARAPLAPPEESETATETVAVPAPDEARAPIAPTEAPTEAARQRRARVHVADNLMDLVSVSAEPEEASARKQQHDLNHVMHQVLVIGLAISTALMVIGIVLDLFLQREIPQTVPNVRDVFQRVLAVRPSGFLALGLLVLIATPILRVIGSIGAFVYEREWRYAAITIFVLAVMTISILLGHG